MSQELPANMPLQTLVGFAFLARHCPDLELILKACGRMGLALDHALMDSVIAYLARRDAETKAAKS